MDNLESSGALRLCRFYSSCGAKTWGHLYENKNSTEECLREIEFLLECLSAEGIEKCQCLHLHGPVFIVRGDHLSIKEIVDRESHTPVIWSLTDSFTEKHNCFFNNLGFIPNEAWSKSWCFCFCFCWNCQLIKHLHPFRRVPSGKCACSRN